MRRYWIIAYIAASASAPALATEYLTSITSDVYQSAGTPREIATRASTCISQNLAAGTTDSQLIINRDLDGGTVVARNAVTYPDGLLQWQVRSTLTFEAREGRFRIVQTNLERFNQRWGPIGKWTGSGWKKAQDAFAASAMAVAQCVLGGSTKRDDW